MCRKAHVRFLGEWEMETFPTYPTDYFPYFFYFFESVKFLDVSYFQNSANFLSNSLKCQNFSLLQKKSNKLKK